MCHLKYWLGDILYFLSQKGKNAASSLKTTANVEYEEFHIFLDNLWSGIAPLKVAEISTQTSYYKILLVQVSETEEPSTELRFLAASPQEQDTNRKRILNTSAVLLFKPQ